MSATIPRPRQPTIQRMPMGSDNSGNAFQVCDGKRRQAADCGLREKLVACTRAALERGVGGALEFGMTGDSHSCS